MQIGVGTDSVPSPASTRPALACPLCDAPGERLFVRYGHWINSCSSCGHRYAEIARRNDHVEQHYGDDYFFGGGAGFPDYTLEAEPLRAHGRRYAERITALRPPGRVLDVGAAAGFLLEPFLERGWQGAAIEPNERMAAALHDRLGCPVHTGSLETFRTTEPFDLVMMIQVIPHFVDMHAALAAASAATAKDGLWLIETWDRGSTTAKLFGRNWHEYSPPTVLHWFTPDSLAALGRSFGFDEVERGRTRKRITAAHAKSLLRYRVAGTPFDKLLPVLDWVPDRLAVPYPGDDLFWMLLARR